MVGYDPETRSSAAVNTDLMGMACGVMLDYGGRK